MTISRNAFVFLSALLLTSTTATSIPNLVTQVSDGQVQAPASHVATTGLATGVAPSASGSSEGFLLTLGSPATLTQPIGVASWDSQATPTLTTVVSISGVAQTVTIGPSNTPIPLVTITENNGDVIACVQTTYSVMGPRTGCIEGWEQTIKPPVSGSMTPVGSIPAGSPETGSSQPETNTQAGTSGVGNTGTGLSGSGAAETSGGAGQGAPTGSAAGTAQGTQSGNTGGNGLPSTGTNPPGTGTGSGQGTATNVPSNGAPTNTASGGAPVGSLSGGAPVGTVSGEVPTDTLSGNAPGSTQSGSLLPGSPSTGSAGTAGGPSNTANGGTNGQVTTNVPPATGTNTGGVSQGGSGGVSSNGAANTGINTGPGITGSQAAGQPTQGATGSQPSGPGAPQTTSRPDIFANPSQSQTVITASG
ncbi:MAG: hypothetical protein Q9190_007933, partial [Brigantiaea leucoxantha]